MKQPERGTPVTVNRRSFLKKGAMAAGAATAGAVLLSQSLPAFAQEPGEDNRPLTEGDIAILRFVAAAELIESDLWIQYAELGGIGNNPPVEVDPNQTMNAYQAALSNLDGDGPQYITSNTLDEVSHATFLNAYLQSKGAEPVNLDKFRTLQGSKATGAANIGRLTNLMHLNVDTSWYVRYRSTTNPDFGATFKQALTLDGVTAISTAVRFPTATRTALAVTCTLRRSPMSRAFTSDISNKAAPVSIRRLARKPAVWKC